MKLLIFAALTPLLSAGLMDDWNICQRKVLGGPGVESSRDPFTQYCVGLGYLTGHLSLSVEGGLECARAAFLGTGAAARKQDSAAPLFGAERKPPNLQRQGFTAPTD